METMGTRLKNLRLERGWTQERTAEELGMCTDNAISKFERDECCPARLTLLALAELFEVEPGYLLAGDATAQTKNELVRHESGNRNRGGFRFQSKPRGRYAVQIYPTTAMRVKQMAKKHGLSFAEAMDQIVEYALTNLEET